MMQIIVLSFFGMLYNVYILVQFPVSCAENKHSNIFFVKANVFKNKLK